MPKIKIIFFRDCPNAVKAKHEIEISGVGDYEEIIQDDLNPGDPNLRFSSPTILVDDQIVFGGRQDGTGGCSIGKLDLEFLRRLCTS